MRYGVNATQCRAAGLPETAFAVELDGMTAAPRPGAYLAGGGPPGGAWWFVVLPAWGMGAASLEPALLSLLPAEDRSVTLSNAPLAGSLRPCLVAAAGRELGRVVAMAALVVDPRACPHGMIVIAACDGRGVSHPALDAVLRSAPLRALCESLTLGEPGEAPTGEALGVLTLRGPQGVTQHPLRAPRALLGRSSQADVVVLDAQVSRQHCVLERRGEGWVLVVLSTAHGVTVHGALRAQGEYLLAHGDRFELGETVAQLSLSALRADASPWQRVPSLEARFASWSLPSPKIPHGVALEETPTGLRAPAWVPSTDPRLEFSWREGEGGRGPAHRLVVEVLEHRAGGSRDRHAGGSRRPRAAVARARRGPLRRDGARALRRAVGARLGGGPQPHRRDLDEPLRRDLRVPVEPRRAARRPRAAPRPRPLSTARPSPSARPAVP